VVSGQRYSPITVDHFQHPRNVGRLADADGVGRVDDPERETTVTLYVKRAQGRVVEARFRTFGCSACVAASSMATELLVGRGTAQLLSADEIDAALGGLPSDKRYCVELVAEAAHRALDAA
jgi:nitrogen fixation protein NifU and related proteins